MKKQCPEYKLGLTVATLVDVTWHGIPYPVSHTFSPFFVARKCGDGTYKGYGNQIGSWTWRVLSHLQIYSILALFDSDTDASKSLYVSTYKDVGYQAELADFLAVIRRPIDGNGKTIIPGSSFWYSAVTLPIEHMVEQ